MASLPRMADAMTGVALVLLAASLLMPWSAQRDCPLFEECGPWTTEDGWDVAGVAIAVLLGLAGAVQALLWTRPPARHGAMLALFVPLAILLAAIGFLGDFAVFGDVRFPLAGYLVAWAATFVGLASGVVGITLAARSATSVPEAARA